MTDEPQAFRRLMEDLARSSGQRVLFTEDGTACTVVLGGDIELNLVYRPATGQVVTFAEVCPFLPTADDEGRARLLLEMNWQWRDTCGFTLSVDGGTGRLMIADRRTLRRFPSDGALGAYLTRAATLVKEIRQGLAEFDELAMAAADGRLEAALEEETEN